MSDQADGWIKWALNDIRSPERWPLMDQDRLASLLRNGAIAYGMTRDETIVPDLARFYEHCSRELPEGTRFSVLSALQRALMAGSTGINALFPVIFNERSAGIASAATIECDMLHPCSPGDPLFGVRLIAQWVMQASLGNRAAIFGGLVSLGDRRLRGILGELMGHLSVDQISEAANIQTALPTVGAFEFWLDSLEGCVQAGSGHTKLFSAFAAGIVRLVKGSRISEFADVVRNFGYDARNGEAGMRILESWTVPELAGRYADRLYALEAAEPPPKIMSHVLIEYGLEARAPIELRDTLH